MALLTWSDKYSVGVKTLDGQHTILFNLINDLHTAMMKGQAQKMTGPILRKLIDYTHTHFTAEEAMLSTSKYPALEAHRALHRELIKQVEDFSARFERGEITVNLNLLNFLRDWLINHIQKTDKEYSSWLNEHGAK